MSLPSASVLREIALESGFDVVGFGPANPGEDGERFLEWIAAGRHASMDYLERNQERIREPQRWLDGARSTISLGFEYPAEPWSFDQGGRVARYAVGRDYHRALGKRLERLQRRLVSEGGSDASKLAVDAAPVLERALALRAGVGFLAKSAGIIHPERGPWLLLSEILTKDELPADAPSPGSCGTCTACLDACPTGALVAPFELDARRCLSWSTIEHRGPTPRELRSSQGDWVFGCDVCIEVCPFVSGATRQREDDPDLAPHRALSAYSLVGLLEIDAEDWDRAWTGTAMRRATRNGLRRNAAITLGNLGHDVAAPQLTAALADQDTGVRSAAAWALAKLGVERDAIAQARDREADPAMRADLEASLEGRLDGD